MKDHSEDWWVLSWLSVEFKSIVRVGEWASSLHGSQQSCSSLPSCNVHCSNSFPKEGG